MVIRHQQIKSFIYLLIKYVNIFLYVIMENNTQKYCVNRIQIEKKTIYLRLL